MRGRIGKVCLTAGVMIFIVLCMPVVPGSPFPASAGDTVVKVFRITYRTAEELEGPVQFLLSPEGVVVSDSATNSLIVRDYPDRLDAIARVLREQDRLLDQVLIRVTFLSESTLKKAGIGIRWQARDGGWAVGNIPPGRAGSLADALPAAGRSSRTVQGEQRLLLMSGREGMIAAGSFAPRAEWVYRYARHRGSVGANPRFSEVSTGFTVLPRVAGTMVNLDISPYAQYLAGREREEIVFREASTTIACRDGETVIIGSSDTTDDNIIWNILGGVAQRNARERFFMAVTPAISR